MALALCCGAVLLWPDRAKANVYCEQTDAGIDFGTSQSGTGSIDFRCYNWEQQPITFTLCVALGTPSWPGTSAEPRLRSGSNSLAYNMHLNPAATSVWAPNNPLVQVVSMPAANGSMVTGSIPFYGRLESSETVAPGTYTGSFYNSQIGFLPNGSTVCLQRMGRYTGRNFNMTARATVTNNCIVYAGSPADLGAVPRTAANVSGSTAITVRCPSGTPYAIGLTPSNGSHAGAGQLSGTGANMDRPPYQLRSGSIAGPVWGDLTDVSSTGNGVAGTGDGTHHTHDVFVTMPSLQYEPDNYSDLVLVTLHF
ncbi:spore coat U domain-containing protein [Altericroceibacterium endophyticum]|uniref:Csu type fimbrial protein n=1 Tax=Altericroceibacterium endophyticum TaxID=1808508 RepID=UPI0013703982|nr:spore coat U domain-containing protein [Altericroceibacterium endophyticum]